jgi:hypothetical protein
MRMNQAGTVRKREKPIASIGFLISKQPFHLRQNFVAGPSANQLPQFTPEDFSRSCFRHGVHKMNFAGLLVMRKAVADKRTQLGFYLR